MFDKIVMMDNTIRLIRYIITHSEYINEFETIEVQELAIDENHKNKITNWLKLQNIPYSVSEVEIPFGIEKYDGMEWLEGRDSALKMINGDTEFEIEKYKKKLFDSDYKEFKNLRGDYTAEQWQMIDSEREEWRQKIRDLEKNIL